MSVNTEVQDIHIEPNPSIEPGLYPKKASERTMGPIPYMFMWIGDGVNLGNMTLGSSLIVAGVATLNIFQTFAAAIIAIGIISLVFALNDRLGYRTGIPYVMQLRMAFGEKGSIISSLLRGIPAIVWYGFQSWTGAIAINEIMKILTDGAFDNTAICFVAFQALQIVLSMYGFKAIKWVETLISVVLMAAFVYVFYLLVANYSDVIVERWVRAEGTWGLEFWAFIMVFMGNYAAIFLSAADYSRELKQGYSDIQRGLFYFSPIVIAYGAVLVIGAMLASVTGISSPVKALTIIFNNDFVTVFVDLFIIMGCIAVNMVANIVAPTYVIQMLTKISYKKAVVITGILGLCSFPWVLVQDTSSYGLALFILIYSAFLGPIVAILLVDYYILRKQKADVAELYKPDGQFSGLNPAAVIAMFIGAGAAYLQVDLAWIIGLVVGGISYYLLTKYAFKGSKFKIGTIFEGR